MSSSLLTPRPTIEVNHGMSDDAQGFRAAFKKLGIPWSSDDAHVKRHLYFEKGVGLTSSISHNFEDLVSTLGSDVETPPANMNTRLSTRCRFFRTSSLLFY